MTPTVESGSRDDIEADRALASIKSRLFGSEESKPVKVGRFVVLRRLGAGGMGVVYECSDPELDRQVALKVLRTQQSADRHRARLLREAKALAAVAHPNVIAVYDVGTVKDQVFIAMEYVEGPTLRKWCTTQKRSVAEIVGAFVQIGRGLAAAHAAGLIHRDLKPDNVIVGEDDGEMRIRVLDFGLARRPEDADSTSDGSGPIAVAPDTSITETGLLVGTPAYMAPEQHRGTKIDVRVDQFGFCVALYEALLGTRPFAGRSVEEQAKAVREGRLAAPELPDKLPAWLRKIVMRGLSVDPAERYASMNELLHELERTPKRRAPQIAAAVGLLVLGAGVSAWVARGDPCAEAGTELAAVWSDERRAAAEVAFGGAAIWGKASADLDAYAEAWRSQAVANCEATRVDHEQSAEVHELRQHCLENRRRELEAVVELLVAADETVVRQTMQIVQGLPRLAECEDVDALAKRKLQVPDDPQMRAKVEALRRELAGVGGLVRAGKYDEAAQAGRELLADAEALGYQAVVAEVLLKLGVAESRRGRFDEAAAVFERAVYIGQEVGHDFITVRAANQLVFLAGSRRADPAGGRRWSELSRATIKRLGGDQILEAERLNSMAGVWSAEGKYAEAVESLEQSLAIVQRVLGPKDPQSLTTLKNLGTLQRITGRVDDAIVTLEEATRLIEEVQGPEHPEIVTALIGLAGAYHLRRRLDDAVAAYARGRAVLEANGGLMSVEGATLLGNLAGLYDLQGRKAEALATVREALAIARAVFPDEHPSIAALLTTYGDALYDAGEIEEAMAASEEAQSRKEKVYGPDHAEVAPPLRGVALAALRLGQRDRAAKTIRRAESLLSAAYPADHPQVILMTAAAAGIEAELGNHEVALRKAQSALEGLDKHESYAMPKAKLRFTMAKSLHALGRDKARVRALALESRKTLEEQGAPLLAEVDAFLATLTKR